MREISFLCYKEVIFIVGRLFYVLKFTVNHSIMVLRKVASNTNNPIVYLDIRIGHEDGIHCVFFAL